MNLKRLHGIYAVALITIAAALFAGCSNSMAGGVTLRVILSSGENVQLGGFGTFEVLTDIRGERIPIFKGGKVLKKVLRIAPEPLYRPPVTPVRPAAKGWVNQVQA